MRKELEKRLARIEKRVAEKTKTNKICNCRGETRFHNAPCLAAILKGASRVCPVHGSRELGFFWWTSKQYPLRPEDNPICPCPPHPWRSFLLSEGPHTWEGHDAARKAACELPPDPTFNFQEDKRRMGELFAEYFAARQQ